MGHLIKNTLCKRNALKSREMKLRLCRAAVLSIWASGTELWPSTVKIGKKLDAIQTKHLQMIESIKCLGCRSNEGICFLTNQVLLD